MWPVQLSEVKVNTPFSEMGLGYKNQHFLMTAKNKIFTTIFFECEALQFQLKSYQMTKKGKLNSLH